MSAGGAGESEPPALPRPLRPTPARRRAALRIGALGLLFLGVTLALAFPNVSRLGSHTPGDYGDAYFYQWLLRWDVHALLDSPRHVFDANIFWPTRDTLIFGDTLLAVAPLTGLLGAIVGPVVAFNVLYLGTWVGSLAATYALARRLTGDAMASVLAAFIFTFAAVRLQHYVHLQLLFAGLLPLALLLLLRFLEERSRWQAAALGLTVGASILLTAYSALMITVALAVIGVGWLVGQRFRPGPGLVTGVLVAVAVAAVVAGPAVWKYRAYDELLQRSYDENTAAHPGDLLAPVVGSYLYGPLDRLAARQGRDHEHRLFPGSIALVLGTLGVAGLVGRRRRAEAKAGASDAEAEAASDAAAEAPDAGAEAPDAGGEAPDVEVGASDVEVGAPDVEVGAPDAEAGRRRELVLILLASAVLFLLAFGKYQRIGGWRVPLPYAALTALGVPGFDSVRAFGRFMVVPLLGVALLAAVGFGRVSRRLGSTPVRLAAGVVVGTLILVEYAAPVGVVPRLDRPQFTAVNTALADLPPGPVLELPMADARSPLAPLIEPPRMVWSSIDWNPRVNGASAFTPAGYAETVALVNGLGDDASTATHQAALDRIADLGVRYVIVRLAPVSAGLDALGVTHYDLDRALRVADALGRERVSRVSQAGAAMLIELRR